MNLQLSSEDGLIVGAGTDRIGAFTLEGCVNKITNRVALLKQYIDYSVVYRGFWDGCGIVGTWSIGACPDLRGVFEIWPQEESYRVSQIASFCQDKRYLN